MSRLAQTRVLIAVAIVLAVVDIAVRLATAPRAVSNTVVTAQEFRLTDKGGNIRAVMNVDTSGEPGLRMFDRTGTLRLQLDSFENTPSLILLDRAGSRRVYYGMENADGSGLLQMMGPNGETQATLTTSGDNPVFTLNDIDSDLTIRNSGGVTLYTR